MKYCQLGTAHTLEQTARECDVGSLLACCRARLEAIRDHHPDDMTRRLARVEWERREARARQ